MDDLDDSIAPAEPEPFACMYRAMVADLYDKGVQLVQGKYRYLRFGYAAFIAAFVAATITYIVGSIAE